MAERCPRCQTDNRRSARFCARCGLNLEPGEEGSHRAATIRHPQPLAPAIADPRPVVQSANLTFSWGSSWGGAHWGPEGVGVAVFNGGYALRAVVLQIEGRDEQGGEALRVEHILADLSRGQAVRIEIPSFEVRAPVHELVVTLVSADFGPGE